MSLWVGASFLPGGGGGYVILSMGVFWIQRLGIVVGMLVYVSYMGGCLVGCKKVGGLIFKPPPGFFAPDCLAMGGTKVGRLLILQSRHTSCYL